MKKLFTPEEIAESLLVSKKVVYKWLNEGRLKGFKAGSLWRIKRDDLEDFLGIPIPWENGISKEKE